MIGVNQNANTYLSGFHGTAALLNLLADPCQDMQVYAVRKLVDCVSRQWFEIADCIPVLEELQENESFPERDLCALILSKVYYYLNAHSESINYALDAGSKFDITCQSEYVQWVLAHCLEKYCDIRTHNYVQQEVMKSQQRGSVYPDIDDDDPGRPIISSHYPSLGDDVVDLSEEGDDVHAQTLTLQQWLGSVSSVSEFAVVVDEDGTDDIERDSDEDMLNSQDGDDDDDIIRDLIGSSAAIDACRESHEQFNKGKPQILPTDPRLEQIVNRLVCKCVQDGRTKQAVGIAIDCRRLDWLRHVVEQSGLSIVKAEDTLNYLITCCTAPEFLNTADAHVWQRDVLSLCVQLFVDYLPTLLKIEIEKRPDYFRMLRCYTQLAEPGQLAELLVNLVDSSDGLHLGLQLAIDLFYSSNQHFRSLVLSNIYQERARLIARCRASREADENKENPQQEHGDDDLLLDEEYEEYEDDDEQQSTLDDELLKNEDIVNLDRLHNALNGSQSIYLTMQFLIRNNRADLHLLKFIKDHSRNMLCHGAVVIANGFMHCGTTCDQFLRDNLDWLGNAQNWARFTATASLGVIHRYHEKEALRLMDAYLPKENGGSSPYATGGGLYARTLRNYLKFDQTDGLPFPVGYAQRPFGQHIYMSVDNRGKPERKKERASRSHKLDSICRPKIIEIII